MNSSSGFFQPTQFTTEWRDITLLQNRTNTILYTASRYGRRFLLKTVVPEKSTLTDYQQQQQKEFQLGISLVHPNIAATYSLEHVEGLGMCIVQEYIDGCTIGEWIETNPTKAARERVVGQLLDTIEYLHVHQLVHRDIKLDNMMITHQGNNLKVIDFGLSNTDDAITSIPNDQSVDVEAVARVIDVLFPSSRNASKARHYPSIQALRKAIDRRNRWKRIFPLVCSVLILIVSAGFVSSEWYKRVEEQRKYDNMVNLIDEQLVIYRAKLEAIVYRCDTYDATDPQQAEAFNTALADYSSCLIASWAVRDSIMNTIPDVKLRDAYWQRWLHLFTKMDGELNTILYNKLINYDRPEHVDQIEMEY